MSDEGKGIMQDYQSLHADEVKGITRVDAQGRIVHTVPYNAGAIGRDISDQEHVREILLTRKAVISDVFTAVQGFRAIAVHVPVFRNTEFDGTVAFLLSFDTLAKRHIESIQVGRTGYAWVISEKGIEISCPVPGQWGRSVYDTCKDFPDNHPMAKENDEKRRASRPTTSTASAVPGWKSQQHAGIYAHPHRQHLLVHRHRHPRRQVMASMAASGEVHAHHPGAACLPMAVTYLHGKVPIMTGAEEARVHQWKP